MPEPICLNKQRLTVASLKTSRRQEKKKKIQLKYKHKCINVHKGQLMLFPKSLGCCVKILRRQNADVEAQHNPNCQL